MSKVGIGLWLVSWRGGHDTNFPLEHVERTEAFARHPAQSTASMTLDALMTA